MKSRYYKYLIALLLIAGCAVGPNYKRPKVNAPPTFRGSSDTVTNSFGDLPWWEVFHDEDLHHLIRVALTNNYDLRVAIARVEQAREIIAENRAGLFPQINYIAAAAKGKNAVGVNNTVTPTATTTSFLGADANLSWELDIWGRIRRLTEEARAQYLATEEARHDITVSLIAQVAQNYIQLVALDYDLQIARDTTNSFGQSYQIFERRLTGGVGSKLETSAAEALFEANAATIPAIEQQIVAEENVLSVLTGQNPGPIRRVAYKGQQPPPPIPPGLPSSLLERRPDIRAAEFQLRAANAQVGVAVADFLPNLNLNSLIGQATTNWSFFSSAGFAWSVGASVTGPIFQGGRLRARYRETLALREQAALQYQAAVLRAFAEVSDALIARQKSAEAAAATDRAVAAYKEALRLALERYRLGKSSYYEVLQQQQLLFPTEHSLLQSRLNQYLAIVQLYRALGGGWQLDDHHQTDPKK